jgi:hypothetical protein
VITEPHGLQSGHVSGAEKLAPQTLRVCQDFPKEKIIEPDETSGSFYFVVPATPAAELIHALESSDLLQPKSDLLVEQGISVDGCRVEGSSRETPQNS